MNEKFLLPLPHKSQIGNMKIANLDHAFPAKWRTAKHAILENPLGKHMAGSPKNSMPFLGKATISTIATLALLNAWAKFMREYRHKSEQAKK